MNVQDRDILANLGLTLLHELVKSVRAGNPIFQQMGISAETIDQISRLNTGELLTLATQPFFEIDLSDRTLNVCIQKIVQSRSRDDLIKRILLLEGLPNLQELGKLLIGENTEEIIRCDLQKEQDKHQALVEAIAVCEEKQDYVSRQLLEKQKDENEERLDWLETQLDLVENLGLQNYLQLGAQED